jgi:alpha-beta hydrolase superfamily lysophospholipase
MKETTWKNKQGLALYSAEWPVKHPKAVIALVHGQGEHIGRYASLAGWYNAHDVTLTGFDQQGYGKSEGKRGHAESLDVLLDDIGQFLGNTRKQYPNVPIFLYGHSLGGGLVLHYVLRRDPLLDGLIVTSPLIRLAFQAPALKIMIGKMLRHIVPTLTLPTGLAANFISHDPAEVAAYKQDPLVHDKLSAAAGISILEMGEWLEAYSGVFSIPVLLMHGGDDKITSAKATKAFFERVAGEVTHREWPGLWHEMHHEKEREQVFTYTLEWMQRFL